MAIEFKRRYPDVPLLTDASHIAGQAERVAEVAMKGLYKEVWPSNAFIGNLMRLIVLKREGCDDQVVREIRGYYLKMAEATGTLWESNGPGASLNHGFASYLAILLEQKKEQ